MFSKALRAAALAVLVASPAFAQIDQQQTSHDADDRYVNYNTGQSFTPTTNTSLGAGVEIFTWYNLPYTTQMTAQLFSGGLPNNGGTLLATATTTQAIGPYETVWVDMFWSSPVSLTPGTKYWLSFLDSHDQANAYKAEFLYTDNDSYAGGNLSFNGTTDPGAPYSEVPGWDMTFREFGENVESTPEPASLVLMATGLLGVFGVARRRKSA